MEKTLTTNILILSTDNAARSIIAEGMLNHLASLQQKDVLAFSGGASHSGHVDPFALEVLSNAGAEVGAYRNKSWNEMTHHDIPDMRIAITVSDRDIHKLAPHWPGDPIVVHWPYPDLSGAFDNEKAKRDMFELTRQAMAYRFAQLLALPLDTISGPDLKKALAFIGAS
ncbi:MAG: putative arsenate reductase [Betaproteobacteria bacterium]|nr:putative arsenate reductase [Betaproteobacteria bacterium]